MGILILMAIAIVLNIVCIVLCVIAVVRDVKRWGEIFSAEDEYEYEYEYEYGDEVAAQQASVVCFKKPKKGRVNTTKRTGKAKSRVIPFAQ